MILLFIKMTDGSQGGAITTLVKNRDKLFFTR